MIGFNLLLGQSYNLDVIESCLCNLLRVSFDGAVVVVCDEAPVESLPDSTLLLVVLSKVSGDFSTLLQFYPQSIIDDSYSSLRVAKFLSVKLSDKCLISDSETDPYIFLVVEESRVSRVSLDSDKLDENEMYVISETLNI